MRKVQDLLHARHHFTVAHAPWTNGKIERLMKELATFLMKFVKGQRVHPGSWPAMLPYVQYAMNTMALDMLGGRTPLRVFMNHDTVDGVSVMVNPKTNFFATAKPVSDDVMNLIQEWQSEAEATTAAVAAVPRAKSKDKSSVILVDFDVGDFVLVSSERLPGLTDKTLPTWRGPYQVMALVSPLVYTVRHVCDKRTAASFDVHATHIKR
jgi:hypothetical protein